jgi:hypothetical protein
VSARSVAVSLAVTLGLVLLATAVYDIPLENALVLAPVFVIGAGAVAGLVVLWWKAVRDNLRRRG